LLILTDVVLQYFYFLPRHSMSSVNHFEVSFASIVFLNAYPDIISS
jgi:hypothetical protein